MNHKKTINNYLIVEEIIEDNNKQNDAGSRTDPIFQIKKKGMSMKDFCDVIVVEEAENDKGIYKGSKLLVESHLLRKFNENSFVLPINGVVAIYL